MQVPMQITFRDIPPSDAIEVAVREKAAKLEEFYPRILGCRVVVEAPHRHHHKGRLYHVRVALTVPGTELVVSHSQDDRHAHEDAYVAVRDAFDAMRKQLEGYAGRQRGEVKTHEAGEMAGVVAELLPHRDHGRIETSDGRSIYFHRHSVQDQAFDRLEIGARVRFVETTGEEGPQASLVSM
ncbi:MAG: HPF/RaiA family ribosome-associated protein [Nitrospirota bacterium]|nr:HPF/RaiA family ribosome-associated protein [Nitrospirota bacterium]